MNELRGLYQNLPQQQLPHDAAVRMVLARVLVAPAFLYRGEQAAPGLKPSPVNDWELATRLSYFLTSSCRTMSCAALAALPANCMNPRSSLAQTRRLLRDAESPPAGH